MGRAGASCSRGRRRGLGRGRSSSVSGCGSMRGSGGSVRGSGGSVRGGGGSMRGCGCGTTSYYLSGVRGRDKMGRCSNERLGTGFEYGEIIRAGECTNGYKVCVEGQGIRIEIGHWRRCNERINSLGTIGTHGE